MIVNSRGVLGTDFWNGASTLKQYFVLPKNRSKYYLNNTFLAFPVLGILSLGTTLVDSEERQMIDMLHKLMGNVARRL